MELTPPAPLKRRTRVYDPVPMASAQRPRRRLAMSRSRAGRLRHEDMIAIAAA